MREHRILWTLIGEMGILSGPGLFPGLSGSERQTPTLPNHPATEPELNAREAYARMEDR